VVEREGETRRIPFDTVLVAVGRKARTRGFGLEEVGVELTDDGRIDTDDYLQTRVPSIYAAGDCVGPYQFTHAASHQAWFAAVNALFWNPFKRFKVDYRFLPHATFTDPEVARVGLSEDEAKKKGTAYEVTRFDMRGSDRALADESARGFVKVLTVPGKDRILGATIVGPRAGDLVAEYTLAMKHGIGLNKILGTIHTSPTLAEANKSVAGAWKRAHAPERALRWVERYHRWRRG
jgi:pyruvate/2-oxoglutarate dehydrogenase complex dihydrolipoamide dehydrogenase (E3) component